MAERDRFVELNGPRIPWQEEERELWAVGRAIFLRRVFVTALLSALVVMLLGIGYTVIAVRHSQIDSRSTLHTASDAAKSAERTSRRIEDCTTPGGVCFERVQKQTSGAVAGINTLTVRATACLAVVLKGIPKNAKVPVDDVAEEIQRCIKSSRVQVEPQRLVPAPSTSSGESTPIVRPQTSQPTTKPATEPKKTKSPKAAAQPPAPTPTESPGTPLLCLIGICTPPFLS